MCMSVNCLVGKLSRFPIKWGVGHDFLPHIIGTLNFQIFFYYYVYIYFDLYTTKIKSDDNRRIFKKEKNIQIGFDAPVNPFD